jgi:hypothetical protein
MHSDMTDVHPSETHDQFVQRANHVFPADRAKTWSRVERAVFNHLMGHLIHEHSYSSITDTMLSQCRDDMHRIVRRCSAT